MNDYWCISSKEDAEFVARMEDVLDVYELLYDPMRPGDDRETDLEYARNGTNSHNYRLITRAMVMPNINDTVH